MTRRTSLVVAIVAFSVALVVLLADTAWGMEVSFEWQDTEGRWHPLVSEDGRYEPVIHGEDMLRVPANGTVDFRLAVANDRPLSLSGARVLVTWESHSAGGPSLVTPVDERADFAAFGSRTFTFTLDQATLAPSAQKDGSTAEMPRFDGASGSFTVEAGPETVQAWTRVEVVNR